MTATKKKFDFFWIHFAITVFFMFIFGHIVPAVDPITPLGMQCLGIFIGIIYAWSVSSLLWPSFLGMVAFIVTGSYTMNEFIPISFGNPTLVFFMLIMVFAQALSDGGLVRYLAAWLMSRKVVEGRPWVFTFFLLLGTYIGGAFISDVGSVLIFWSVLYEACHKFGFKPYEKYPSLMVFAIAMIGFTIGGIALPFRLTPLVVLGMIETLIPEYAISMSSYIIFMFPITFFLTIVFFGILKYVFRIDLSKMSNIGADLVDKNDLILSKAQKYLVGILVLFIVLLVSIDILPASSKIGVLMKSLGPTGVLSFIFVLMIIIKIDGKSLIDFKTAAHGIMWEVVLLFVFILPFASYFASDATGVKVFLIDILSGLFAGKSPVVAMVLMLTIGTILTNFANNAVLMIIFVNIAAMMFPNMGVSPVPFMIVQCLTITYAYMIPAASAPAALVFANTEWIKASFMYKYIFVSLVILFVVTVLVGLPYAFLLFG